MPVTLSESIKETNGQLVEHKKRVDIACDNPTCTRGLKRGPMIVSYDPAPEAAGETPREAYAVLILVDFLQNRFVFCSKTCLKEFLSTFVSPKAPGNLIHFPDNGIVE